MNTGIPRNQNDGVYSTYGDAQSDGVSLREGHVIYVRSASLYAEVVTSVTPYPISGSNPALYIKPQNTTPGTGETNTGSNVGDGEGTFAQKAGTDLQFHSQVNQFGIESRLIGDTYYRGLNPFIALNNRTFFGDMLVDRNSASTSISNSNHVYEVPKNTAVFNKNKLGSYALTANSVLHSENLGDAEWRKQGNAVVVNAPSALSPYAKADGRVWNLNLPSISPDRLEQYISNLFTVGNPSNCAIYFWGKSNTNQEQDIRVLGISGSEIQEKSVTITTKWQRFEFNMTEWTADDAGVIVRLDTQNPIGADILVTMFQVTNGRDIIPYIKTESAAVVRPSDSIHFNVLGNVPASGGVWSFIIDGWLRNDDQFRSFFHVACDAMPDTATWQFRRDPGGTYRLLYDERDGSGRAVGVNLQDNDPHRFIGVYDGTELVLYIDGSKNHNTVLVDPSNCPEPTWDGIMAIGQDLRGGSSANNEFTFKWLPNEAITADKALELGGPNDPIL